MFPDNHEAIRAMRTIRGRFFLNGAGVFLTPVGRLFTATRTGVGTATVKVLQIGTMVHFDAVMSKAAILNRMLHVLGWTQGTDGMWTASLALTDLNNAGVVAAEFAAANAAAFISFSAYVTNSKGDV
jgi:hypothetical protein